jgi:tetratricopeptide (TPR) repeat protein
MTTKRHGSGIEALEDAAWQSLDGNRLDDSLRMFTEILAIDHSNEAGLQGKTASLRKLGRIDEAERCLETALKLIPKSVGLLSERAWLDIERSNYDNAIKAFREVLHLSKRDVGIFRWLLSLLRRQKRFDEAAAVAIEALTLFPDDIGVSVELGWVQFGKEQYEDASKTFAKVLEADKRHEGALQGQIASLRLRGRYDEAMRRSERALAIIPRSPGILSEMGWLAFEQGRFEDAERAFAEVVSITPKDQGAYLNLAWSLERQGDPTSLTEAAERCLEALNMQSDFLEANGCLGVIAFRQGRIRDAESRFIETIALNPLKGNYADLGALYIQMGRYDDAESQLKKGLESKGDETALHLQLGSLYLQTDRLKDAIAEFRQALALDPMQQEPPRALAVALMESGKYSEAEIVLRGAMRKLDTFRCWRLHLTLSEVLARMSETMGASQLLNEALVEVNAALRLKPDHPDPLFYAGIVRFKLEDYPGALLAFQRCHEADESRVDAEINARRVRALIKQEKSLSRTSVAASAIVGSIVFFQLVILWIFRWLYGAGDKAVVSTTMITILVPICLGLLVVAVMLPWLSKLKLTGLEVELSNPEPKKSLASGPKGEINFETSLHSIA